MKLFEKIDKLKVKDKYDNFDAVFNEAIDRVKDLLKQELKNCYQIKILELDILYHCKNDCDKSEEFKEINCVETSCDECNGTH
jgi:hypothetical protein